jgi:hypothetical protein
VILGQTDNHAMPRLFAAAALLALAACMPTLDWRELRVEPTPLHATFPCKPDRAERKVRFAPQRELLLHAVGCEAGGASFAVLWADLGAAPELASTMEQWQRASLASWHARNEGQQAFLPSGALDLPQSVLVRATGQRGDGTPLQTHAAYFSRGTSVYQAVVHASTLKPEMADPFFAGLRFE